MQLINIGIVAHVDAGKTTLTEQMMFLSGAIRKAGSVDEGTTHTDFLEMERARGITVKAATAVMQWKDITINLIDTPGHVDFTAEVERSLRVLDLAVLVISAVEGIQSQTEIIFEALRRLAIPVVVFINKTDRAGADADKILSELRGQFAVEAHYAVSALGDAPDEALTEAVAAGDDNLLEQYLAQGSIDSESFTKALGNAIAECALYPVLTGIAMHSVGVEDVLEMIALICKNRPAPVLGEDISAVVFRVEHEKSMGRTAHVRLYGGSLKNRDSVYNTTRDIEEKIVQIRKSNGEKSYDVGTVGAGDIAVICGLSKVRTGDILGSPDGVPSYISLTQPLLNVSVIPESEADWPLIVEAFEELNAEEPLFDMQWESSVRQLVISITGLIQLEFLTAIMTRRFGLKLAFSPPQIIYKETPKAVGYGFDAYTMPKPCWAVIKFLLEPMPRGFGMEYKSIISPEKIPYRYQSQIEQALPDALRQGPLGWGVTDLRITLEDGGYHHIHTHPLDFIVTTPMAMSRGLHDIGTTLLEPMQKCRVSVPEEMSGKLISEIIRMRGTFDNPVIKNGTYTLEAVIPAATSMDFPTWVASASSGKGILSVSFDSYQECPLELGKTTPYRGINPIDRAKYILHIRGAL